MSWFDRFFKKNEPNVEPTGRTINMTRRRRAWGHNISLIKTNGTESAEFWVWVTPGPKVGDWMKYEVGENQLVTVQINEVGWTRNVADMYRIDVTPVKVELEDVQ